MYAYAEMSQTLHNAVLSKKRLPKNFRNYSKIITTIQQCKFYIFCTLISALVKRVYKGLQTSSRKCKRNKRNVMIRPILILRGYVKGN